MIKVDKIEQIRRAYHIEGKSIRQIAREQHVSRRTVSKAISQAEAGQYTLTNPREAPVLGRYKAKIKELLESNDKLPGKHRLTGQKIFNLIWKEGYRGSVSGVRLYLWQLKKERRVVQVFIPLEFEPGQDAQVDWGEAQVLLAGQQETVQLFVMRLCYSRKIFTMAFPSQKGECFWEGHVAAFEHFGGVPARLSYDNLKTAVKQILLGHDREEQDSFILFRSHHLFESHYCTPGQGHEKGRVEDGVGYIRRNFMSPLLEATDFADLNRQLLQLCLEDDQRQIERQPTTIHLAWQEELPKLLPLPPTRFDCCRQVTARLNGYSQIEVETNRYSVPTDRAATELRVKLYPFEIKIYRPDEAEAIAIHPRNYGHKQDILDPLHYLPLLYQRPGAFNHAKPIQEWRASWPEVYNQLLAELQQQQPNGAGVRQFIRILQLHQHHPANLIEQAVTLALQYHCPHADGVELCLRQLLQPEPPANSLDLSQLNLSQPDKLANIGQQPLPLEQYNQLLTGGQDEQPANAA